MIETAGPTAGAAGGEPLCRVETWVFDLDNTLYPASCNLFAQVDRRMGEFICRQFALGWEEARALQKRYFREHGTTLRGLMTVDGLDPVEFLSYVHDIDLSALDPAPDLDRALGRLDGRKLVFTNGSARHAERVLDRLGIAGNFDAIVDIVASSYRPKPDPAPYAAMVERYGFDPRGAAMVEDIARNLIPAHALGMTTVWLRNPHDFGRPGDRQDYIHHVIDELAPWLAAVAAARRPG